MKKNLSYIVVDNNNYTDTTHVKYDYLLKKVMDTETKELEDLDDQDIQQFALLTYQFDEYKKKELEIIADYYQITKRKKKKEELIQDIVIFELDPQNMDITQRRKTLWFYMEEIKSDNYLRKYLILD